MTKEISPLSRGKEFELNLNAPILEDIVSNKIRTIDFDPYASYENLSTSNQKALQHLVKAAVILDDVFLKQDHPDNIRAKNILKSEAAKGNKQASQALSLFTIFNGLQGDDMYAPKTVPLRLFKNKSITDGAGVYPQDISKVELVDYIVDHPEQAAAILSNNTVVRREKGRLIALPYSIAFREEMEGAARELLSAARKTDHAGFAQYLRWQAQALVNDCDPELVFNADKTWLNLEDSPLEFTIGRECYNDRLSGDVAADPRVEKVLKENGICAKLKDFIGVRVGIVNQESQATIALYRKHQDDFALHMPLAEQYTTAAKETTKNKMAYVDVDLVAYTGDYAAIRQGISVAQNLPNKDKLAAQLGVGSRLVFHRQPRFQALDQEMVQHKLNTLVDPSQRHLYEREADFMFIIGHEFAHSHGPRKTKDGTDKIVALGRWGNILEECKSDLASFLMADYLASLGAISIEQRNKIYMTCAVDELPTKQPAEHEAHRMRAVMQVNYLREKGAITFEKGGRLSIDAEKTPAVAREMLEKVIAIQLAGDANKAQAFVERYVAWNDALQYAVDETMKSKPRLYRHIRQPLRDKVSSLEPV